VVTRESIGKEGTLELSDVWLRAWRIGGSISLLACAPPLAQPSTGSSGAGFSVPVIKLRHRTCFNFHKLWNGLKTLLRTHFSPVVIGIGGEQPVRDFHVQQIILGKTVQGARF